MRALNLIKTLSVAMFIFATVATTQAASDKTSEKAREAVENAEPNDWSTLAESAEKCLRKKVNIEEANEWIKKSIVINKNEFNLTLKGDYHMLKKEPRVACEYYLDAMKAAQKEDRMADVSNIQHKLYQAKKQIYK